MTRNKLYLFLLVICLAGYAWIFTIMLTHVSNREITFHACIIKQITNIPCPSCGSSRAIFEVLHGNFMAAIKLNPLGLFSLLVIFTLPIWIVVDFLRNSQSFFYFYEWAERTIKQKKFAIPLATLIVINWIWNIYKGL